MIKAPQMKEQDDVFKIGRSLLRSTSLSELTTRSHQDICN
jgi:hypothetical protein